MKPYADLTEALSDATWGAYSFLMIRDGIVSRWTFGVDPYSQDATCPAWDVRPAYEGWFPLASISVGN